MQIYVGDGHKFEIKERFYPKMPPIMRQDPKEYLNCSEPNPSQEILAARLAAEKAEADAQAKDELKAEKSN
jgi:hypothetical protein